jgi:hypothetical protein
LQPLFSSTTSRFHGRHFLRTRIQNRVFVPRRSVARPSAQRWGDLSSHPARQVPKPIAAILSLRREGVNPNQDSARTPRGSKARKICAVGDGQRVRLSPPRLTAWATPRAFVQPHAHWAAQHSSRRHARPVGHAVKRKLLGTKVALASHPPLAHPALTLSAAQWNPARIAPRRRDSRRRKKLRESSGHPSEACFS